MRKFGKYEKMRRNAIMQTYITSLLCLVLCVTMFFGTTMAWFTDTTVSQDNEMYVGILDVDLKHATFSGDTQQKTNENMDLVDENYQVFKKIENGGIRWEPGYTAVEKFELTENGNLAFSYQLGFECDFAANDNGTAEEKQKIAQAITVWSYDGKDAESITELPKNFEALTEVGWTKVGTLYDVITNKLPVFEGEMNKDAVTATKADGEEVPAKAYHLIALHMDENFDGAVTKDETGKITASVQGKTLDDITIKLVATQKHSEQDAFDNTYDAAANNFAVVSTAEELKAALAAGTSVVLNKDIQMPNNERADIPADMAVVIDLNGHTLTSKDGGDTNTMAVYVNNGAKLTLNDTAGDGKIVSSCYGVYVKSGATFIMNGGTIDVSGNGVYDHGVAVWNGKFVMNGGTINAHIGVCAVDSSGEATNSVINIANGCVINTVATSMEPADMAIIIADATDATVIAPESMKIYKAWPETP